MDNATSRTALPPVRACIFDLDGTLINSEAIYMEFYKNILHEYGKPDLTWSVNARMQSTGRKVSLLLPRSHSMICFWTEAEAKIRALCTCSPDMNYL